MPEKAQNSSATNEALLRSKSKSQVVRLNEGPKDYALVLGMVWSNEKQAKKLEKGSPAWRDFNRLSSLQGELACYEIHCVTHNNQDLLTCSTSHNLNIGRRGAIALHKAVSKEVCFSLVICDYFRFPCEYMREAYEGLLAFLEQLNLHSRLSDQFQLLLPNLQRLKIFDDGDLLEYFEELSFMDMDQTRNEHPLFKATEKLEKCKDGINLYLSGYCNNTELKQLDPEFPFLCCHNWVKSSEHFAKQITNRKRKLVEISRAEQKLCHELEARRISIRERMGLPIKQKSFGCRKRKRKPPLKKRKANIKDSVALKKAKACKRNQFYEAIVEYTNSIGEKIHACLCRFPKVYKAYFDSLAPFLRGTNPLISPISFLQDTFKRKPMLLKELESLLSVVNVQEGLNNESAVQYLKDLKSALLHHPQRFETFLNLLTKLQRVGCRQQTINQFAELLDFDRTLLLRFTIFLEKDEQEQIRNLILKVLMKFEEDTTSMKDIRMCYVLVDPLKNQMCQQDWMQFLKCLPLYFEHIITKEELIQLVSPFLDLESPEFKKFQDILDSGNLKKVDLIEDTKVTDENVGSLKAISKISETSTCKGEMTLVGRPGFISAEERMDGLCESKSYCQSKFPITMVEPILPDSSIHTSYDQRICSAKQACIVNSSLNAAYNRISSTQYHAAQSSLGATNDYKTLESESYAQQYHQWPSQNFSATTSMGFARTLTNHKVHGFFDSIDAIFRNSNRTVPCYVSTENELRDIPTTILPGVTYPYKDRSIPHLINPATIHNMLRLAQFSPELLKLQLLQHNLTLKQLQDEIMQNVKLGLELNRVLTNLLSNANGEVASFDR